MSWPDTPQVAYQDTTAHRCGVVVGGDVTSLVIPGLRRNPRRAHLLVSTVLGKHIPAEPSRVLGAATQLARQVHAELGDAARDAVVLGFAETATGLGHGVWHALGARLYLSSTRREVAGMEPWAVFEEEHSHATSHRYLLAPQLAAQLPPHCPVVLVDDEVSTGTTAWNAASALLASLAPTRIVVASLVDLRSAAQQEQLAERSQELGVPVAWVSLAQGQVSVPEDLAGRLAAGDMDAELPLADYITGTGEPVDAAAIPQLEVRWPRWVPESGRHGICAAGLGDAPDEKTAADDALAQATAQLDAWLRGIDSRADDSGAAGAGADAARSATGWNGRSMIVVGHEELMYTPTRLAAGLEERGWQVRVQSSTRSPAVVSTAPGDPLRRGFQFRACEPEDGDAAPRYLYNCAIEGVAPAETLVVFVVDSAVDTELLYAGDGPVAALHSGGHPVAVVTLPRADVDALSAARSAALRGPEFGSYSPSEVAWLLRDLSHVALEQDVAERERNRQIGGTHYAESLPTEYQPGETYLELYHAAVVESSRRLAVACGVAAELIRTELHRAPVLVSLARAGTPIGILMRRWLQRHHGYDAPHYAVSIVRDRGIDAAALDYLAARYDAERIVFVDGWTGKGAITKELADAIEEYAAAGGARLNPTLAVLADPGHCTSVYGTRDDFLIASSCLNSTVSGLVSRTVLRADLTPPGGFHGAKFYRELAPADVSNSFLDAVSAHYEDAYEDVTKKSQQLRASDRTPTWSGWESVEKVRREYGLTSINHIKPGIGETTRVLLRRVPWKVLVARPDDPVHAHIRHLAAERGVPVEHVPDLAYACMGIVRELA